MRNADKAEGKREENGGMGDRMLTEREKMLAGELYDPLDPELVAARVRARDLCQELNATRESDEDRAVGSSSICSERAVTTSGCSRRSSAITVRTSFSASGCSSISTVSSSTSARCASATSRCLGQPSRSTPRCIPLEAELRRTQEFAKPVTIGADVWVGGAAVICPGVTIGSRSVIGAGSVVTRDIPEDVFAAGNPCRVIRQL